MMIRELQHMPSRTRIWLNQIGLADIDPAICIYDVTYEPPDITTHTVDRARYNGSRVTRQRMGNSSVVIEFGIMEYDIARRQNIVNRVVAWAMAGGVLTIEDRPNQCLHVVCTGAPSIRSTKKWADVIEMEFSAFDQPFWEDVSPAICALTGTEETGQLNGVGAAADPFVEARVEAAEAITALTLTVANTFFEFEDISIDADEALVIGYDKTHTLYIVNEDTGVSYLDKRTPESSDDLMLPVGKFSYVSFESDGYATVVYKARGLYL